MDDFLIFEESPGGGGPLILNEDGSIADGFGPGPLAPIVVELPPRSSDLAVLAALAAAWWVFA